MYVNLPSFKLSIPPVKYVTDNESVGIKVESIIEIVESPDILLMGTALIESGMINDESVITLLAIGIESGSLF